MFKRNLPAWAGLLAGVLVIALAYLLYTTPSSVVLNYNSRPSAMDTMDTGTRTSYNYYGGDAYTGMQQASADAARNVKTQSEIILAGFRSLPHIVYDSMPTGFSTNMTGYAAILLGLGLAMVFYFGSKIAENSAKAKFEKRVLEAIGSLSAAEEPAAAVHVAEAVAE